MPKCALSRYASTIGEAPGSDCSREALEGLLFCQPCQARITDKLIARNKSTEQNKDLVRVFFAAVVGALGTAAGNAAWQKWDQIVSLAERLDFSRLMLLSARGSSLIVLSTGNPAMRIRGDFEHRIKDDEDAEARLIEAGEKYVRSLTP